MKEKTLGSLDSNSGCFPRSDSGSWTSSYPAVYRVRRKRPTGLLFATAGLCYFLLFPSLYLLPVLSPITRKERMRDRREGESPESFFFVLFLL